MTVYDWNTQLAVGKAGEEVVKQWLRDQYVDGTLSDVRDDPDFQALDVDFIAQEWGSANCDTYEVKTDFKAHETGNLFLEHKALRKSQADYWLLYVPQRRWLFRVRRQHLEWLAHSRTDDARQVASTDGAGRTWYATGVPIRMTTLLTQLECTLYTQVGGRSEQPV